MKIKLIEGSRAILWNNVRFFLENSRFTGELEDASTTRHYVIKIRNIRLREKKPYCGNHPAMCENTGETRRKGTWLEGADWVEFNDSLNDICDRENISADIRSSICILRKGRERRMEYGYRQVNDRFTEWNLDDEDSYENWCGKEELAPASEFPFGTPGLYLRGDSQYSCVG
jgi:hypothetical protein